jgi:hypothetical protein
VKVEPVEAAVRIRLAELPVVVRPARLPYPIVILDAEGDYKSCRCRFAARPPDSAWSRHERGYFEFLGGSIAATAYDDAGRAYRQVRSGATNGHPTVTGDWRFEMALPPTAEHIDLDVYERVPTAAVDDGRAALKDRRGTAASAFELLGEVADAVTQRHRLIDIVYDSASSEAALASLVDDGGLSRDAAILFLATPVSGFTQSARERSAHGRRLAERDMRRGGQRARRG